MTTHPYTPSIAQDAPYTHEEDGFFLKTEEGANYFVSEDWQRTVANDIADMFRYTRYLIHKDVTCHYLSQSKNDATWADNGFSSQMIDGIAAHVLGLLVKTHYNIMHADDFVQDPEEKDGAIGFLLPLLIKEPEEGSNTPQPSTEDQATYTRCALREIIIKHMEVLADDPKELEEIALSRMPYASEANINLAALPIADIFGDIVTCAITALDVCAGEASLFTPPPAVAFQTPEAEQLDISRAIAALQYNFSEVQEILFTTAPQDATSALEQTYLAAQEEQLKKMIGDIGVAMFPADPVATPPIYRAGMLLNELFMPQMTFSLKTDPVTQQPRHSYEDWARPETAEAILSGELEVVLQTIHHNIASGRLQSEVIFEAKTSNDATLSESQQLQLLENGPETLLSKEERDALDKANATICSRLKKASAALKTNIWIAADYKGLALNDPQRVPSARSVCRAPAPARLQ